MNLSIFVKCFLTELKGNFKNQDLYKTKMTRKKFLLYDLKFFLYNKYICKMQKLQNIRFSKKFTQLHGYLVTYLLTYLITY